MIATCQSLEKFLPPKERIAEDNDSGQLQILFQFLFFSCGVVVLYARDCYLNEHQKIIHYRARSTKG